MTFFILINPTIQTIRADKFTDYKAATRAVGLNSGELDHGIVARSQTGGFGIWVYEWGLKKPLIHRYFALNRQLFNGPAVIYAFDQEGETANCTAAMAEHIEGHHLTWIESAEKAELLIRGNIIDRPQSTINGQVFWEWTP